MVSWRSAGPAALRAARHGDLPAVRLAWWALRAGRAARRQLRRGPTGEVTLPAVPRGRSLPAGRARRIVSAVGRLQGLTCLESAVVRQRHVAVLGGDGRIVVGVTSPDAGFSAHAWLEGEDPRPGGYVALGYLDTAPGGPGPGGDGDGPRRAGHGRTQGWAGPAGGGAAGVGSARRG